MDMELEAQLPQVSQVELNIRPLSPGVHKATEALMSFTRALLDYEQPEYVAMVPWDFDSLDPHLDFGLMSRDEACAALASHMNPTDNVMRLDFTQLLRTPNCTFRQGWYGFSEEEITPAIELETLLEPHVVQRLGGQLGLRVDVVEDGFEDRSKQLTPGQAESAILEELQLRGHFVLRSYTLADYRGPLESVLSRLVWLATQMTRPELERLVTASESRLRIRLQRLLAWLLPSRRGERSPRWVVEATVADIEGGNSGLDFDKFLAHLSSWESQFEAYIDVTIPSFKWNSRHSEAEGTSRTLTKLHEFEVAGKTVAMFRREARPGPMAMGQHASRDPWTSLVLRITG